MTKQCEHKWIKLYYRNKTDKEWQSWNTVKDVFICQKCLEIRKLQPHDTIEKEVDK